MRNLYTVIILSLSSTSAFAAGQDDVNSVGIFIVSAAIVLTILGRFSQGVHSLIADHGLFAILIYFFFAFPILAFHATLIGERKPKKEAVVAPVQQTIIIQQVVAPQARSVATPLAEGEYTPGASGISPRNIK
jgi:hypothetical protein